MRTLAPAPGSLFDPATRSLRFGSYRGSLPPVDLTLLERDRLFRLKHRKRWMYAAIAADDLLLALAVVHTGYAMTTFVFAFDRATGRMVVDRSQLAPPLLGAVGDSATDGALARISVPGGMSVRIARPSGGMSYAVDVDAPDLTIHALLSTEGAPPSIGAVAPLAGDEVGLVNVTEKGVLLPVTGEAVVAGRRRSLDGALAGYDYTQGYLPRRTSWRWMFLLGRATSGERVAVNLVQGFVGEAECAVWIDGELHGVGEGRFAFDPNKPLDPWRICTDDEAVDLRFEPGAVHAETKNLGLISSRFIQPAGTFSGTIRIDGRAPLTLDRVLGVTEDQDVLW